MELTNIPNSIGSSCIDLEKRNPGNLHLFQIKCTYLHVAMYIYAYSYTCYILQVLKVFFLVKPLPLTALHRAPLLFSSFLFLLLHNVIGITLLFTTKIYHIICSSINGSSMELNTSLSVCDAANCLQTMIS